METKNKGLKIFLGFIAGALLAIALFLGIYNLLNGNRGKNEIASLNAAYNNSVKNGFDGSMADWLSSIDEKFSYEVAVENGFHGTKEEWYTDLIEIINNYMKDEPEPLTYGITNVQVIDGNLVFTFSDGSTINVGTIGKSGSNGEAGADGESGAGGAQGPAGKDGKDGKDGSSIENLEKVTFVEDPAGSKKYYLEFTWTVDGVDQTERTETYIDVNSIDVDAALDKSSTHAIQNQAVANEFDKYIPIPGTPGAGDNGKAVIYDSSSNSFKLGTVSGGGSSVNVVDSLTSTSAGDALSAKQGKVLNESKLSISGHTTAIGKYLKIDDSGNVSYVDITGTLPAVSGANKYLRINSTNNGVEWNAPVSSFASITTSDNNLVTAGAVKTELDKKVNVAQGAANKDKILKVNDSGNLVLVDSTAAITVDSALSDTSTNPVQNKVINTALDGKVSIAQGAANKDKILKVNDSGNLVLVDSTAAITVDSALSDTSTNPVQNKVINTALNGKVNKTGYTDADKGKYLYINDSKEVALGTIPDALPAIGDNAYNYLRVKSDKSGAEWNAPTSDLSSSTSSDTNLVTAGAVIGANYVPYQAGAAKVGDADSTDKGKILKVGADGKLVLVDAGGSYTGDWDGTTVLADGNPLGNDVFTVLDPLIGAINVDDSNSKVAHIPAVYKNMIEAARTSRSLTDAQVKSQFGYDSTDHTLARGSKYIGETVMSSNKGSSMITMLTNVVLDDFGHIEWIDSPLNIFPITNLPGPGGYLAATSDDKLYWEDSISLNDEDAFTLANKSKLLKVQDADIYIESKIAGLVIPKTNEGIGADSDTKIDDYSEEYVKTLTKTDSPTPGSDEEGVNKKIELYSKKIFSKSSPITFGDRYYIAVDTSDLRNMYISFAPNDSTTGTSKPMSMHTLIVERDQATDTQKLTFTEYNGSTISMDKINNSTDTNANRKTLAKLAFNHSLQGLLDSIPEETIKSETIKYYDDEHSYGRAGEADIYEGSIIRDNEEKVLMKMPDGTVGWSNNLTIPILDLSTMVEGEVWFEIPGNLSGITDAKPLKANLERGYATDPTLKMWYDDLYNPFPGTLNHFASSRFISNFLSSGIKTTKETTYSVNSRIDPSFQYDGPNVPYQYVAVLDEDAIGPSFRESLFYGDTSYLDSVDFTYDLGKGDYSTESISFSELEYGAPCPLLVTFTNFFGFSGKTSTNAEYKDIEDYGMYNQYAEGFGGNYLEPLRSYLFQPVEFRIGSYDYVPHTRSDTEPAYTGTYHQNQMKTTRRIYTEITYYCIVFDEGAFSWSYNAQDNYGGKTAGEGNFDILTLKLAFYPEGNYLTSGEVKDVKIYNKQTDTGPLIGVDDDEHRYPSISYNFGKKDAPCIKMTLQRGTWSK